MADDLTTILAGVGPRLRALRTEAAITLAQLSERTDISVSTLSRLESGRRRPTLEQLLPLAQAYQVPLDELVGAPPVGDPRIDAEPFDRWGVTFVPLTRQAGGIQAFKQIIPAGARREPAELAVHDGYEWLYVLSGRLRLILADRDLVMKPGEAAEFDTRVPHWHGKADDKAVEILTLYGDQGERMHVRAKPGPPSGRAAAAGTMG